MSETENTETETTKAEKVVIQRDIRKIASWQDVDRAMGVLRGCDAELGQISADFDAQIAELEAKKAKAVKPLVDKRARVEALITEFAPTARAELGKKKSLKLVHGRVGWKLGSKSVEFVHSEKHTIRIAQARNLVSLLRVRTDLDKSALKKLSTAEQLALGVQVSQVERLYIELSQSPAVEYPAAADDGEG